MPRQGQEKGTPKRRAEFMEYLRGLGEGADCVYWPWSENRIGYTRIYVGAVKHLAHRWVYSQVCEPIERQATAGAIGPVVMHSCDNPPCVRPSHLHLSTQQINIQDAYTKRRMHGGTGGGGHRKLSDADVETVRRLAAQGVQQSRIARAYNVSDALVSSIVHGKQRAL